MNEQEAYRSMIRTNIVNDNKILIRARAEKPKPRIAWRRILVPVATVLVLLLGLSMAIPSVRAEVLSWFTPRSAANYIAIDPEEREPEEALEPLISEPETSAVDIKVNYCADEPYWRDICEHFSVSFGITIFDGETMYIVINFDGLSGYPILESETGDIIQPGTPLPLLLAEKLDPEMVRCFHEDDFDDSAYRNGSLEQWMGPDNAVILTLPDGTRLNTTCNNIEQVWRPIDVDSQIYKLGIKDVHTEEEAEALRSRRWEYVRVNGMRGMVNSFLPGIESHVYENGKMLSDYLDENGDLKLHVRYISSIDHGEETEVKLDVDLGTVTVNMTAYKDIPRHSIAPCQETIALSGDMTFDGSTWDEDNVYHRINYTRPLDGVTFRVIRPGYVDLLGVHEIGILITMPEDWGEEVQKAFVRNLFYTVQLDGEPVDYACGVEQFPERRDNKNYLLRLNVTNLPFDRIRDVQTVTLIPTFYYVVGDDGKTVDSSYPEWSITLHVNN